jgi:hypothetical protein
VKGVGCGGLFGTGRLLGRRECDAWEHTSTQASPLHGKSGVYVNDMVLLRVLCGAVSLSVLAFIGPLALLELRCVAIVFSQLFSMSSVSAPINLHARRLLLVLIAVASLVADVPQVRFLYSSDYVLRYFISCA